MYLFVFILINFFLVVSYHSKKLNKFFLLSVLVLLFIEPAFQKLSDPTLYGKSYMVFGIDRLKTNIIMGATFIFILMYPKNKTNRYNHLIFFVLVIMFHLLNVNFSITPQNSMSIFIVSVLIPILLYKTLMSLGENFYTNNNTILLSIYLSIIVFIGIGLLMYNQSSNLVDNNGALNRTGGGLWLSNISTQVLSLFFPLLLLKNSIKRIEIFRIIALVLFFVLLSVSLSRTALFVYLFMILFYIMKSKNKIFLILGGLLSLAIFYYFLSLQLNYDLIEMYQIRFQNKGSVVETLEGDERIVIYNEVLNILKDSNLLLGNGISSFNHLNKREFSNAHNIFLNLLVERGILGVTFVLCIFIYTLRKISKLRKNNRLSDQDKKILNCLKLGLIGFFLIGMTGNDLFINSGFISSWPISCIVISIAIIENKTFIYKKYKRLSHAKLN